MPKAVAKWTIIVLIVVGWNVSARTQDVDGRAEYLSHCATCHGVDGKGNGPSSTKSKRKYPNLTELAKRNKGMYSSNAVYQMIDGRDSARSHRLSVNEIPIWGCRHGPMPQKQPKVRDPNAPESILDLSCPSEEVIRDRIQAIVEYLEQIQVK